MKIRYLTLLTTLVFLGFTVSAFAKGKPVYFTYDVELIGDVYGESDTSWGDDGNQVYSLRNQPGLMNLNHFRTFFNNLRGGKTGENCFGDLVVAVPPALIPAPTTPLRGFLREHKKGVANGMFWFRGFTGEPLEADRKAVLYLLVVTGEFLGGSAGWPENEKIMDMTNWELKVENEGKSVANRSCEGSAGLALMVTVDKQ
jgi:hypothetical protein